MSAPAGRLHRATWQRGADATASAPGRANLIGEHTDYNGGPVLPFAVDRRICVAASAGPGSAWQAVSSLDGRVRSVTPGRRPGGWPVYLWGVLQALGQAGHVLPRGGRMAVAGDVPPGAGLSSSAALCVALVRALAAVAGVRLSRDEMVELAYRAEHDWVGVACGRMDQTIAVHGRAGHALLLDTATGRRRLVPFHHPVLLIETGRAHRLTRGALNRRHAECARALALLRQRVPALGSLAELAARPDGEAVLSALPATLRRRARHVSTETRRVHDAARALAQRRPHRLGQLLAEGHASLRDDFESSCVEADAVVDWAMNAGAWGARLTGAGWGGTVLVLGPSRELASVRQAVERRFARRFGVQPACWLTRAEGGVRLER